MSSFNWKNEDNTNDPKYSNHLANLVRQTIIITIQTIFIVIIAVIMIIDNYHLKNNNYLHNYDLKTRTMLRVSAERAATVRLSGRLPPPMISRSPMSITIWYLMMTITITT